MLSVRGSDYLPLTSHHNPDKKYRFSMERYWAVLVITHVDREENWICLPWVLLRSQPKPTSNSWHYITTKGPFLGLVGWILIFFFILNWFSFCYNFFKSLWKKKIWIEVTLTEPGIVVKVHCIIHKRNQDHCRNRRDAGMLWGYIVLSFAVTIAGCFCT